MAVAKMDEKSMEYINRAINLIEADDGGLRLTGRNISGFDRLLYILGNSIEISGYKVNNDEKREVIRRALYRAKTYRKLNPYLFRRSIEIEYKGLRAQKKKFYVIFPTNIPRKLFGTKSFLNILGFRIEAYDFNGIKNTFEFQKPYNLLKEEVELKFRYGKFSYLLLKTYSYNEKGAFDSTYHLFDILRALINFYKSYGMITWQFGKPKPLSVVYPAKFIFVFDENRRYINYWKTLENYDYTQPRLLDKDIKAIMKFLKDFNALKDNILRSIIAESLVIFNQALDEIEKWHMFLYFWQILEFIALKDQSNITEKKVCGRIKSIFKNDKTISDLIDALYVKRNQLIHEGRYSDFSLKDVNQIKSISENAILFLFDHVNKFDRKDDLEYFYKNIGHNKEALSRRVEVLKYIKKLKV